MIELLRYLESNGFLTFIVSGGDRDFMRPVAEQIYRIPRERVVGSGFGVEYRDGTIVYSSKLDAFDDGPEKPLRIWARTGRRPAIAVGNSNGDLEMLRFAGGEGKPALRLVVRHDDAEREVADTTRRRAGARRRLHRDQHARRLGDGVRLLSGPAAAGAPGRRLRPLRQAAACSAQSL